MQIFTIFHFTFGKGWGYGPRSASHRFRYSPLVFSVILGFLYSDISASYYFQLAKNISVLLSLPAESNRGIANTHFWCNCVDEQNLNKSCKVMRAAFCNCNVTQPNHPIHSIHSLGVMSFHSICSFWSVASSNCSNDHRIFQAGAQYDCRILDNGLWSRIATS